MMSPLEAVACESETKNLLAAGVVTTHHLERRPNALDPVIERAKSAAVDGGSWHSVWDALVKLAQSTDRPEPLLGYADGEGVKYRVFDSENPTAFLTRDAFRKRWQRQR